MLLKVHDATGDTANAAMVWREMKSSVAARGIDPKTIVTIAVDGALYGIKTLIEAFCGGAASHELPESQ